MDAQSTVRTYLAKGCRLTAEDTLLYNSVSTGSPRPIGSLWVVCDMGVTYWPYQNVGERYPDERLLGH